MLVSCCEVDTGQKASEENIILDSEHKDAVADEVAVNQVAEAKVSANSKQCDGEQDMLGEESPSALQTSKSSQSDDTPLPETSKSGRSVISVSLTEEDPENVTSRLPCMFLIALIVLLLLLVPLLLGFQAILALIAKRGKDFVATFQVVMNIVGFVMACFSALNVGVLPQVAAASSAKNYTLIGRIFRVIVISGIACGVVGTVVLLVWRIEFFELFSNETDFDKMVELGETMLILMGLGFLPSLLVSSIQTVYQGVGYMVQLMAVGFLQVAVGLFFLVALYDEYGLDSFGWSNVAGSYLALILLTIYLVCINKWRHLYNYCAWSTSDFGALRPILRALGWVSVRSLFNQMRTLIMVALVTKLGFLYGATYPVLLLRSGFAYGACAVIGFFFTPFLCSRLWGYGLPVLALQLFTDFCKLGLVISVLAVLNFVMAGKKGLQEQVEDVLDESEEEATAVVTTTVYVLFLLQCLARSVVNLYDGAAIAFDGVAGSGMSVVVSLVVFLVIAIPGHRKFEILYLAELSFFVMRGAILHWYLLRKGWSPLQNFPSGVELEPQWQKLLEQSRARPCIFFPLRRLYLGYVVTCLKATFDSKESGEKEWKVIGGGEEHKVHTMKDVNSETLCKKNLGDVVVGRPEGQWLVLTSEAGFLKISVGDQTFLQCLGKSSVKDMIV